MIPARYRVVALNQWVLRDLLARAPLEGSALAQTALLEISLPLPARLWAVSVSLSRRS